MTNLWHNCKNILIIRPDNMGDVIMMTSALRAIKRTFGCRITLLTSKMGSVITPLIKDIDETLIYDLPWARTGNALGADECWELIGKLKDYNFDGVIISTVYSQNPLPAATIAFLAGIPRRLAYCRENPYELLTDWIPDKEPYTFVQHQVTREINLVKHIGAETKNTRLSLNVSKNVYRKTIEKLAHAGVNITRPWVIMHPGVSEAKREYPVELWIKTAAQLYSHTGDQVLITGIYKEKELADEIEKEAGEGIFSVAGLFTIEEFVALIAHAKLVISVNTATVHIAAATGTPVVVLYALTNPQHTPWKVPSVVLPFNVRKDLQSKNEVIQYVNRKEFQQAIDYPSPTEIVSSAIKLLSQQHFEQDASETKMRYGMPVN